MSLIYQLALISLQTYFQQYRPTLYYTDSERERLNIVEPEQRQVASRHRQEVVDLRVQLFPQRFVTSLSRCCPKLEAWSATATHTCTKKQRYTVFQGRLQLGTTLGHDSLKPTTCQIDD